MHDGILRSRGLTLFATGLIVSLMAPGSSFADDSSFLGRLFRLGGGSPPSSASTNRDRGSAAANRTSPLPYGPSGSSGNSFIPPANPSALPSPTQAPGLVPPATPPLSTTEGGPTTPDLSGPTTPPSRVMPRSRVSNAVTTADPLLIRTALGRSNDGSQFGMFLQIFTDGTVIDSEGVHRLRPSDLKPIVETIQSGELSRIKGHCGTPSGDFIEHVHLIVFDRRLGRLTAHSFSYSGNPQGCDHAVRHLHSLLETLQTKLSRAPMTATTAALPTTPADVAAPGSLSNPAGQPTLDSPSSASIHPPAAPTAPLPTPMTGPVIPLTPLEPR